MGIFSFLTGSGDKGPEDRGATSSDAAPRSPTDAGVSASDTGRDAAGDPQWNFGALAEPLPSSGPSPASAVGPGDPVKALELKPHIVEAISTVFDPEIPVNIYELGLIYDIIVDASAKVLIKMTLTSPACPSAQSLPGEVQWKVKAVPGVSDAVVDIVWEPPWSPERMSDVARLQLGMF